MVPWFSLSTPSDTDRFGPFRVCYTDLYKDERKNTETVTELLLHRSTPVTEVLFLLFVFLVLTSRGEEVDSVCDRSAGSKRLGSGQIHSTMEMVGQLGVCIFDNYLTFIKNKF